MSTNHPLPRGLVAIVLVSLAAGCSSLTIDSEWDRSVDFNAFHSEAWIPQDAGLPASQQLAKHLDIRLRRVVDDIMIEDKGFGRAPALPAAGLLPAYHIDTQKELRVDYAVYGSYYGGYGHGYWPGYVPGGCVGGGGVASVREYTTGTLGLDIVDRRTKTLVWTAVFEGEAKSLSPSGERVQEVMTEVLKGFPPTP
jgi:hypothetical protein